jgi:sterol desaturase/sphingolipid hydroxylase (fatty acid hydroxylase superfamily)
VIDFSFQIVLLTIFGGMAVVMAIESVRPLHVVAGMPLWRWLNNLLLTTVDYAVMLGISPWLGLLVIHRSNMGTLGLLGKIEAGPVLNFIVVLFVLELTTYWVHRAFHAIPILWRIHAVHHCDTEVDATTAHRHHPLEVVISSFATLPVMVALGPGPETVLAYNVLHAAVAVLSHGNFSLGHRLDGLTRIVFVTPDFHRVHHSAERRYTDSNYGSILSMFDYILGTATYLQAEQQKGMQLGLSYFREKKFVRLDQMLLIPFLPQFEMGRAVTEN